MVRGAHQAGPRSRRQGGQKGATALKRPKRPIPSETGSKNIASAGIPLRRRSGLARWSPSPESALRGPALSGFPGWLLWSSQMTILYTGGERHVHAWRLRIPVGQPPVVALLGQFEFGRMPSFLAFSRQRPLAIVASEEDGHLCSVELSPEGALSELSRVDCPGGPAYVSLSASDDLVFSASYGSGETRCFSLDRSGRLVQAWGAVSTGRFTHCALWTGQGTQAFVASKGEDQLVELSLDRNARLVRISSSWATPPGTGPRHIAFAPESGRAYVACENDASLLVYKMTSEDQRMRLELLEHVSTLPRPFMDGDSGSDVHVSENERFIYVSNRGHDSIAIFETTLEGVRLLSHVASGGSTPRNFALLDGLLVMANQESRNLVIFERDPTSGALQRLGLASTQERPFWVGSPRSW